MFAVYKFVDGEWYYWGKWNDKEKATQVADDIYYDFGITCKVVEE